MHIFQSNRLRRGRGTWRWQAAILCLLLMLSNSGWSGRVVRGAASASPALPPTRPPQDLAAFIAVTNQPSRSQPVVQPVIVTDFGVPHTLPQPAGRITPTVAVGLLPMPVGFSGAWTLPDATLYLRSRVYQPSSATTRFVQRDTFAGFAEQPQSRNRYSYAWGNPVLLTDPTGNCPLCVAAAGGAAIGAGIEGVRQIIETGGICDWGQIGKAGLAGGIGGLGAAGLGLGLGTSLGTGLLGTAARGGLSGGLGGGLGRATSNGLNGRPLGQGVPEATALGGGLGAGLGALGRAGAGRAPTSTGPTRPGITVNINRGNNTCISQTCIRNVNVSGDLTIENVSQTANVGPQGRININIKSYNNPRINQTVGQNVQVGGNLNVGNVQQTANIGGKGLNINIGSFQNPQVNQTAFENISVGGSVSIGNVTQSVRVP